MRDLDFGKIKFAYWHVVTLPATCFNREGAVGRGWAVFGHVVTGLERLAIAWLSVCPYFVIAGVITF